MDNILLYTDGTCFGNPGPMGIGVYVVGKEVELKHAQYMGKGTNNQAEYLAMITGIRLCKTIGAKTIHVRSDSQLLINQITGKYKIKHPALQQLAEKLKKEGEGLNLTFEWVPREKNTVADMLAKKGASLGQS